jgi:putative peptidoglycan lipid II flippase
MATVLHVGAAYLSDELSSASPLYIQAGALALLSVGGAIIYFALAFGTGGADLGMIRRNVRRRGGGKSVPTAPSPDP